MWIAIRTKKTHELNNKKQFLYNIHAQTPKNRKHNRNNKSDRYEMTLI